MLFLEIVNKKVVEDNAVINNDIINNNVNVIVNNINVNNIIVNNYIILDLPLFLTVIQQSEPGPSEGPGVEAMPRSASWLGAGGLGRMEGVHRAAGVSSKR